MAAPSRHVKAMGASQDGIYREGTVWAKCIQHVGQRSKAATQQDGTLYCVGNKGSGKSTIIDRFLGKPADEPAKPTDSPQYTYARLPIEGPLGRSKVGHIWEVAGPPSLVTRFSTDPNVFLPTARPAVVLITVDLSQPVAAVQSAMHWLGVIGQHTMHDGGQHVLAGPGGVGGDAIQQCMALWDAQHPDILARAVTITGIPIIVVGTKYDLLHTNTTPEALTLLNHTLRALAHTHAAHLVMVGGGVGVAGAPRGGGGGGVTKGGGMDRVRALLRAHLFQGWEIDMRKFTSDVQRGSHQQLYVPMGCDRMSDIGTAPGASQPGPQGWLQALSAACGGQSTQSIQSTEIPGVQSRDTHPHQGVGGGGVIDWDMYAEPEIDVKMKQLLRT